MSESSKTKNSIRNITFGFILKLYKLFIPFVIRTIMIHVLGLEYVGLNSLFVSILDVLNIAELGVGYALVFSMYKPIAENDTNKICALMNLYKLYYRIIGIVILVSGSILTPFIPYLIKDKVPADINVYVIYWLNLLATVLSYWLFSYKNSLFQAHQRNDVISKVTIIVDTIKYIFQISLIIIFKNYYLFLIVALASQALNNILIAIRANKAYPLYKAKGKLPKAETNKINSSIADLFFSKVGMVVTNSVDAIVISSFLGIIPLAIYQNYYYIVSSILTFFTIIMVSCRAALGNNVVTKTKSQNYSDFKVLTFGTCWFLSFSMSCLVNLYQPFIKKWVGIKNLLGNEYVILFAAYLLVYVLFYLVEAYKDAAGSWHKDRFRPMIGAIVNLVVNIILVNYIGLYGIIISTIIALLFINIPWIIHRVFIDVFDKSNKIDYILYLVKNVIIVILVTCISKVGITFLHIENDILNILIRLVISSAIGIALFAILNFKDKSLSILTNKLLKTHK